MYLKSLEMIGFKSFVDHTKIELPRGFTAIVGPNGCGKSNISDAIRWVIGEQSSKSLRSTRMEDLIFNGSMSRRAIGMAEVSITIANLPKSVAGSSIPIAEEARVTRRFYRSGESEYFINKTPCRLRDIIDLFLDTGISSRAFSIIEQGHIQQLISARPYDRRFIIEEAAGIMKYKHRRNEALRKIAASEENLLRVNDTLIELKRQSGSLKRQASRAESFKKKKAELNDLSLSLYATDYRRFMEELKLVGAHLEDILEDRGHRETDFASFNNKMESLKIDATTREKDIAKAREAMFEMGGTIEKEEARIGWMKKQIEDVVNDRVKAKEEVSLQEEELARISKELVSREEEIGRTSLILSSQEEMFEEKNARLEEIRAELDQAKSRVQEMETEMGGLNKIVSQKEGLRISLQTRLGILVQREEDIRKEERELSGQMEDMENRVKSAEESFRTASLELDRLKERQNHILLRLATAREERKVTEAGWELKKHKKSEIKARLNSLEEFQRNFEGLQEGARSILKERETGNKWEGVRGILADVLEISSKYESAIESALGDRLKGLIVEDHGIGLNAIRFLKSEAAGRISFLPLNTRRGKREIIFPAPGPGMLGPALELVKADPEYIGILNDLMEDIFLVEDLDTAISIWGRGDTNCSLLTLEGDIISPGGVITGGSPTAVESSLLRKKRMIHELGAELADVSGQVEEIELELKEKRERVASLEAGKSEIEETLLVAGKKYIHSERDLIQARDMMANDRKRLDTRREEAKSILSEKEASEQEARVMEEQIGRLTDKRGEAEKKAASHKERVSDLHETLDSAREEGNECKLEFVSLKAKMENLSMDMKRLKANRSAIEARIAQRQKNHREAEGKKARLEESIKSTEKNLMELSLRHQNAKGSGIEKEEALRGIMEDLSRMEEKGREYAGELDELRDRNQELELKKTELSLRLDNIVQRLNEDFDIGTDELLAEYTDAANKEEYSRKISLLKEKLSRFGDVNMGALEEYDVVRERYDFLNGQYNDLTTSIADLNKAIEKINKTTVTRFGETFEKVNENFKMTFRRLFAGGKAEMVLTSPDNLLETGIDIVVQPPGKRRQNIIMLSAGEKAMTALSILFSVFMTKPSPFCLLDEIDAPLDEANIVRFKEILRELSDKTQFIIVTHNQTTMTFAETIYGVTMEEKGVSKIVSVNLQNYPGPENGGSNGNEEEEGPPAFTNSKLKKTRVMDNELPMAEENKQETAMDVST